MEGDCDTAERDAAAANDWEDEGGERVSGAYGGGNAGRGVAWREVDDDKRRRATTRSTILGGDDPKSERASPARLTRCSLTASGVRPIQRHLQVAISRSRCKAGDAVAAALLCRPAQSDRGDEQLQGRDHHHDSRQGTPPLLAAVRRGSAFMAREEAPRLFGRYSSGPLVGPRPVTAWPAGRRTSARHPSNTLMPRREVAIAMN
nr:unnamed protein product [Digitaria exilis]